MSSITCSHPCQPKNSLLYFSESLPHYVLKFSIFGNLILFVGILAISLSLLSSVNSELPQKHRTNETRRVLRLFHHQSYYQSVEKTKNLASFILPQPEHSSEILLNFTYGTHRQELQCELYEFDTVPLLPLPSLLRTMAFRQDVQLWMRVSILISVQPRMFFTWQSTFLLFLKKPSRLSGAIAVLCPCLETLWLCLATFIFMFQHKIDRQWQWLIENQFTIFGVTFGAYGITHLIFTALKNQSTRLLLYRASCLSIFISTIFYLQTSYRNFLDFSPCFTNVSYLDGFLEYICLLSIFLYISSYVADIDNLYFIAIPIHEENFPEEGSSCMTPAPKYGSVYTPAYLSFSP